MLFEDSLGHLYPLAQIRRIRPRNNPTGKYLMHSHVVDLAGGADVEITSYELKRIKRAGTSSIPAQTGMFLLCFCDDNHSTPSAPFVWRMPVLGFSLGDESGVAFPVVLDPEVDGMTANHAILHPCGLVEDFAGTQFDSEADWLVEQNRCAAIDREREKANG